MWDIASRLFLIIEIYLQFVQGVNFLVTDSSNQPTTVSKYLPVSEIEVGDEVGCRKGAVVTFDVYISCLEGNVRIVEGFGFFDKDSVDIHVLSGDRRGRGSHINIDRSLLYVESKRIRVPDMDSLHVTK
jgi:hypothetical protein